jgi:signal transduction histidine kinase
MNGQISDVLSQLRHDSNFHVYVIISFLVLALIIDSLISTVVDFLQDRITSYTGMALFILIACAFVTGQYFVLQFIKEKTREIRLRSRYLSNVHNFVTIVQYSLAIVLILTIVQMLTGGQYHILNLFGAQTLGYSLSIVILLLFAERLFRWYQSSRNSLVVLLYGISAVVISFSLLIAMIGDFRNMIIKEPIITPDLPISFPSFEPGTLSYLLSDIYHYSDLIATILVWSTTVLLLYHYFDRLSRSAKIKVWVLITLPLIYFLSTFAGVFELYSPETDSELFWFYIYTSLNSTAAGILFALAFRIVAKSIRQTSAVRGYMIIAAFGFALLFISNQSFLTPTPYPPFGLASVSMMGLSAYLILVGIYSAGISISEDINLRRSIKKTATEEAKLLVSIGSAQMQQQLEKRVLQNAKKRAEEMTRKTGVQLSLTDGDMRQYLNVVLKEIKLLQNVEEILIKGKEILETSVDYSACFRPSGLRLVYNNYFDVYEKIMERYRKGDHDGIRLVTSIDKDSVDLVRAFLKIGVQVRHVKNLPPLDFSVSDKDMVATILKSDYGEMNQNLLVSNEAAYLGHFASIFEELWKGGVEAESRINAIEEGVDSEGIEIIQNPTEILNLRQRLIKSAQEEILMVYPASLEYVHLPGEKTQTISLMELLKESVHRGVKVRIVASKEDSLQETLRILVSEISEQYREKLIELRYMEPQLQTKVSVVVVDKVFSLAIELKDYTRQSSTLVKMGLATYSNSKATVLSYVSFFETLWKQTDMYEQLKVHDRMQKEFINIAAHELRNPIQPLVLSSESLKGSMPDEERISIVIRNAKKLQMLANEILDITKIESKTLKLNKEKVNVNEIIVHSLKDLLNHQTIAEGKVNLIFEPGGEDIFVEADRDRLGQVVSNLLNNSVKFTHEGTISIVARKLADAKEVVVSIKDTGSGIDPEILPRLFSKFVTKSDAGGTGLGLFICKSIVEAHGGKIWAENNRSGKGATFSFSLPASPPDMRLPSAATYSVLPPNPNQG